MFKILFFIPEIYFFVVLCFIFIFNIINTLSVVLKFPNINLSSIYIAIISLIYTFTLFLNNIILYVDFSILFKSQSTLILSNIFILMVIFIFIVSISYNSHNHISYFEYLVYILISLGSLIIFLNVINIILIYILLELQNILISILISIRRYNRYCIEASIKYFILGSFSSLIFLYGFSILYGCTGLLSLYDLSFFLHSYDYITNYTVFCLTKVAFLFILVGLLFKIYSAPFHFWVGDIYEGSPISVLIYISSIQFLFMILLFIKLHHYLFFDILELKNIILSFVSVLTLCLGSIGALIQRKLKKLIGYSAITVSGFFIFSVINNNIFLIEASIMYLFVYVLSILLFFGIILNLFVKNNNIVFLSDLFNIYKYNKYISVILVLLFFSVSGLPPFIGFMSKLFWIKSFFIEYNIFVFFLIFIFLIVSFYYIRLIKNIYMNFDKNYYNYSYLSKYSYCSSVSIMLLQFLLLYFVFDSSLIRDIVHILTIDFLNFI